MKAQPLGHSLRLMNMDTFLQDIRYGLRVFLRNSGFTAVAVLLLGLGIGANSAMFSVINSVLLRPLSFREPERLVQVHGSQTQLPISPVSAADYLDWKARTKMFENISCFFAIRREELERPRTGRTIDDRVCCHGPVFDARSSTDGG